MGRLTVTCGTPGASLIPRTSANGDIFKCLLAGFFPLDQLLDRNTAFFNRLTRLRRLPFFIFTFILSFLCNSFLDILID